MNADRHMTGKEITKKSKLSNSTVHDHLKCLGFVLKFNTRVPHNLKKIDLAQCITICDLFLKREKNDTFLKRIIAGDEKWIVYNNFKRKRL